MLVKGFNLVERSSKILLHGLMNVVTMLVGSGNCSKSIVEKAVENCVFFTLLLVMIRLKT